MLLWRPTIPSTDNLKVPAHTLITHHTYIKRLRITGDRDYSRAVSWILLRLFSITAGPMNDSEVSGASVYIYWNGGWVSSHAVCLKCVSSTSYQEQPWKCSCRAVVLSFCHGGSHHALWRRRRRHLPREMDVDGRKGGRGKGVQRHKNKAEMS